MKRRYSWLLIPAAFLLLAAHALAVDSYLSMTGLLRWSATKTPSALGELGMDVSTGRPLVYVSGAAKSLAVTTDSSAPGTVSIDGLAMVYSSTSKILVNSGHATDSTLATTLTLSSQVAVDVTATGSLGVDSFTSAATMSTTNASKNATASASILTELGVTTLSWTFSSSTTTITPANVDPRGQVWVGDLIGSTATYGFSRVTAVTATSITVTAALPGGSAPQGTTAKVIRNPTQKIAADAAATFDTIAADGVTIVLSANAGATASGRALVIGGKANSTWFAVWLRNGASGTTVALSTQGAGGSLPYSITGYSTYYRRVGWILVDGSGNVQEFSQAAFGGERVTTWETNIGTSTTRVVSAVTPTANTWTLADAHAFMPPTTIRFAGGWFAASGTPSLAMRPASTGNSATLRPTYFVCNGAVGGYVQCNCDPAQRLDWQSTQAVGVTIDVASWWDDLTK